MRDLIVELIQKKRELYKQKYDFECERLTLEEKYYLVDEGEIAERDQEFNDVENRLTRIGEKIVRAHVYGLKHAKGSLARCIDCFIEREELPDMQLVISNSINNYRYKCKNCGHEVKLEF